MNLKEELKKVFKPLAIPLVVAAVSLAGLTAWAYQFGGGSMNTAVERHQQLLWVYNTDAVAHEAGDVLVWADGSNDGLDVSTTSTFNNKLVAGVVPAGYTLPASNWGFVQTHGYHSGITVGSATAAGDMLATSATAESASVFTVADSSVTHSAGVFAIALEATTSSTTVKGFIIR